MKLSRLFAMLLLSVFAVGAHADELPQQDLKTALPGTAWEGTFEFHGQVGQIRVAFLPSLDGAGQVQYVSRAKFSGFICPARLLLSEVDQPCAYTPRAIEVLSPTTGKIHVYSCADSAETEAKLAATPGRPAKLDLNVNHVELVHGGDTLEFEVIAGPMSLVKITYDLHAAPVPADAHAWIDELK